MVVVQFAVYPLDSVNLCTSWVWAGLCKVIWIIVITHYAVYKDTAPPTHQDAHSGVYIQAQKPLYTALSGLQEEGVSVISHCSLNIT